MVASLRGRKAVVAKLGMDAHWRGVIVVANALRDAGMEVVYLGHALAEDIATAAVQEDAVLIGLSSLSGNHLSECPLVTQALEAAGARDVAIVLGGAIPPRDYAALEAAGIDAIFGTGTSLQVIIERIAELVAAQSRKRQSEDA